jgi:RNase P subunit RPR2
MYNGQIINLLEYQDGQQFIKRAITLLEESQALLSSENDKEYIDKIREIEKNIDLKKDPSEMDRDVKDMICEIKKGIYC